VKLYECCLAGCAGVTIRHANCDALLQGEYVVEVWKVAESIDKWRFARAWISEYVLHPFETKHLEQGLFAGHVLHDAKVYSGWYVHLVLIGVKYASNGPHYADSIPAGYRESPKNRFYQAVGSTTPWTTSGPMISWLAGRTQVIRSGF